MVVGHFTVPNPLPGTVPPGGGVTDAEGAGAQEGANGRRGQPQGSPDVAAGGNDGIAGMSTLRGLIIYGAVLAFIGLYSYFMILISESRTGVKPAIDATLIAAAAALSGVLGSAFALQIGVPINPSLVNGQLAERIKASKPSKRSRAAVAIRQVLSLEPSDSNATSWPLTVGIWAYAAVASTTLAVYVLNQNETPGSIKALAVTFGGYVLALLNMAYRVTKAKST